MTTKEKHQKYYIEHREEILARVQKRYREKSEAVKQYAREYYQKNKAKHKANTERWIKNNPDKSKRIHADVMQRRRARLRGVESDNYNRLSIYNLYGGYCIVCNDKIDISVKHPNKACFTIHHIIPISKGGDNTSNNVAPAHFGCNILAGDKIPIGVRPRVYYG